MIQEILPYIAGALQWARARKKFADAWYAGIVVVASFGFYMLQHPADAFAVPWNEIVAGWWEQAKTILAITQAISTGSNIADDLGVKGVPVTDSK